MALPFPVIYMSSSLATQVANKTSYNNNQVGGGGKASHLGGAVYSLTLYPQAEDLKP